MQPSTAFIPVTSAVAILAFLVAVDLELFRPTLPSFPREPDASGPTAPATPPMNRALETKRLHEATDCIDGITSTQAADFASCLQIYSADFPSGPGFSILYARRDSRIRLTVQAEERAALWQRLAEIVAEDDRAPSPGADETVREALAQVRPFAGTGSDEQRRLFAKAEPIARAVDDSERRRADLRAAAQHWGTRSGIDYEDYSNARGAITAYDRKAFSAEDQAAWETLDSADALVAWSKRAITNDNRAQLPIAVVKRNPGEADYGLMSALTDDLAAAGFHNIVKQVESAAVLIELADIRRRADDSGEQTRQHAGYPEEMFRVTFGFGLRLAWIGARGLPPAKISDEVTDTTKEATAAAVAKTAAAAVAAVERFTRTPPP